MKHIYLEGEKITVGYGKTPLLSDLDLQVKKGEILTLIGPNGAGKSTLLKTITRQLALLGGVVTIENQDMTKISSRELAEKQAVVLTERPKTELMRCMDVVAAGRYPYTNQLGKLTEKDYAIIRQSMEQVHALDLCMQDFNEISDGQKQRVLLARALCQEPEILVLDEPTSYLDIRHKLEVLQILKTLSREKQLTILLSLHEIDLAQKISDQILCVSAEGKIKAGTPEEVFQKEQISQLYHLKNGSYNPLFGSIELPRGEGTPKVFVLAGAGSGIPVYRSLQKKGIPFVTGILFSNDIDFQVAEALAAEVIVVPAFTKITEAAIEKAKVAIRNTEKMIYTGVEILEGNRELQQLLDFARDMGKQVEVIEKAM